jgi:hypothetical protein
MSISQPPPSRRSWRGACMTTATYPLIRFGDGAGLGPAATDAGAVRLRVLVSEVGVFWQPCPRLRRHLLRGRRSWPPRPEVVTGAPEGCRARVDSRPWVTPPSLRMGAEAPQWPCAKYCGIEAPTGVPQRCPRAPHGSAEPGPAIGDCSHLPGISNTIDYRDGRAFSSGRQECRGFRRSTRTGAVSETVQQQAVS